MMMVMTMRVELDERELYDQYARKLKETGREEKCETASATFKVFPPLLVLTASC